ncbi:hypothetical protein R3P38DRAFT_1838078 [Favolaschia claudopus]|uniref:Uncharacterized protein n=1 Tax=Favolaschia claudopus TaxID=2862362 RepID=A0AAW0A341_9AGAR
MRLRRNCALDRSWCSLSFSSLSRRAASHRQRTFRHIYAVVGTNMIDPDARHRRAMNLSRRPLLWVTLEGKNLIYKTGLFRCFLWLHERVISPRLFARTKLSVIWSVELSVRIFTPAYNRPQSPYSLACRCPSRASRSISGHGVLPHSSSYSASGAPGYPRCAILHCWCSWSLTSQWPAVHHRLALLVPLLSPFLEFHAARSLFYEAQ